jgi:hypothetical protein
MWRTPEAHGHDTGDDPAPLGAASRRLQANAMIPGADSHEMNCTLSPGRRTAGSPQSKLAGKRKKTPTRGTNRRWIWFGTR